jgi:cytochrome c-type biogenesis protein CcmE
MVKIIATILAVAGAGGILIYSSLSDAQYFVEADEVLAEPDKWLEKSLRVHGFVEAGSIEETIEGQATTRKFVLFRNGAQILVHNIGPKPDTFRDESEVVAKGRLVAESWNHAGTSGDYQFKADELMAKCPSKYDEDRQKRADSAGVKY